MWQVPGYMQNPAKQSSTAKGLFVAAAIVIVVAGMKAAAPIVIPFLLALFLAIVVGPGLAALNRSGLPLWLAFAVVVVVITAGGAAIVALVGTSINELREGDTLTQLQAQLLEYEHKLFDWLESHGIETDKMADLPSFDPNSAVGLVRQLLFGVSGMFSDAFLLLMLLVFILLEMASVPGKLRTAGLAPSAIAQFEMAIDNVRRYMALKTLISPLTAVLLTIWLAAFHIPYAMLWGLLAFLLNYIPNIGSLLAAIPPLGIALLFQGPISAVWVATGYLVINLVVGNVIEPRVLGRGLGLSMLVVVLSLVFWGWVLGPVGMLLSVPLTMCLRILLAADDDTRWIAVLMGTGDDEISIHPTTDTMESSTPAAESSEESPRQS